jgi:cytoskeleton protein RodZ
MPEIGPTLREARMRARIDVSEIEAQTKIRAKYLRALENEEWSLLPGPTFVKSFLRTYAQALGLDGKALVEEYRLHHEGPGEGALEPIVASPRGPRRRTPSRPGRGYMAAVGVIGAVIVLLIVLLVSGGGSSNSPTTTAAGTTKRSKAHHAPKHAAAAGKVAASTTAAIVTLSLQPTAVVYVCLVGDNGRRLIPGLELQPGERTPTYHARRFEVNLGNNALTMFIDGRARTVPASSAAIGYSITKARGRQPLLAGHLPTCK